MTNKAKITIVDLKKKEKVIIPLNLSIEVIKMLVEDSIENRLSVIIEPVIN